MYTSLMQLLNPSARANAMSAMDSSSGTSGSASTTSSTDPGVDLTQTFMQLLSVQLENQSPIDPVDPNQFVTQLANFDSLGELTQIQELMQTLVNDVGGGSNTAAAAANVGNSISTSNLNPISH